MGYWFTDPMLKALLPLAGSTSIKGLSSSFTSPTIIFGPNIFPEGDALGGSPVQAIGARCPGKRAFFVTDEHAEKYALRVSKVFETNGFSTTIWNKALPEAPLNNIKLSAEAMNAFEPDLIVAVGGGSVIDGAKAAWILYERPDITDLSALSPLVPLMLRSKAILAAVPTTSGTGSECTAVSVVHDSDAHRKIPLASGELMPDYALLLPEFTESMPPKLTVGTGLDVLAHAMDCVPTSASNEITDALALAAIEMVFKWLPRAYANGRDREARYRMSIAASIAGLAFGQGGIALTHSFGHSLGSLFNIHHGLAVGLFIPYALQFYMPVTDKWLSICKALEIKADKKEESMANLQKKIQDLFASLNAPLAIRDMGISKEDFEGKLDKLVVFTVEDISSFASPRPMTEAQCEKIFQYAYAGKSIDF